MIYYIAHPYTNNPKQSYENVVRWMAQLRRTGFVCFSPICHAHPFQETLQEWEGKSSLELDKEMNYVGWDLEIIKTISNGDGCPSFEVIKCPFHDTIMQNSVDLEGKCLIHRPNGKRCKEQTHILKYPTKYDSKITILMSKKAYRSFSTEKMWASSGCKKEYEFAKKNLIRVLVLEEFLEGREVEI